MLMRAHDGAVDHSVFVVGVFCQRPENTLPNALSAPSHVARVDDAEIAETLGQITPGDAGAIAVKHRFDKQAIVFGCHPNIRGFARQKLFNPLPLIIAKGIAAV